MLLGDDGAGFASVGVKNCDVHIEFARCIFGQGDTDVLLVDVSLPFLDMVGRAVAEHFKPVGRLADDGAQGDGNGKSNHSRSRDADAHGVLQNIGTQTRHNALRTAAQFFCCTTDSQSHANGLCASNGWNDLFANQTIDGIAFFYW